MSNATAPQGKHLTTFRHRYNDERECWMSVFYRDGILILDEFGIPQIQYWKDLDDFKEMIERVEKIDAGLDYE